MTPLRAVAVAATFLVCLAGTVSAQTSVAVELTPHATVVGTTQVVSFGVPLPPGLLLDTARVRLLNESGSEIPAFVRSLGPWRQGRTGIRSVLVQFEILVPDLPWRVTVEFGALRTLSRPVETPVRSTWRLVTEGTYSAMYGVWEPNIYATLPAAWLAASGLVPFGSVSGAYEFMRVPVDDPMGQFFSHLVNQFNPYPSAAENIRYLTDYEPWLYDRAQAMFQLYIRTGALDALREAHRAAQHYQSLLYTLADCPSTGTCVGQFRLKVPTPTSTRDAKYSYTASIATDYWLTGDPDLLPRIADAAAGSVTEALPTNLYTVDPRFTERNFGIALFGVAHYYDVTGDENARTQAALMLDGLQAMQNVPANSLPSNGCFHYRPEEATGAWGFSPWMSALLGHGLYRAYESFGETRALGILGRLATCVAERGVAMPYSTTSPAYWYSRYLGTSDGSLEFAPGDAWSDAEHSVDVAYLMALGAWSLPAGAQRDHLILTTHRLLRSQQLSLGRFYQPTGYPGNGLALYRVIPPRKYAWWYTLSPAIGRLLGDNPPELAAVGVGLSPAQGGVSMEGDVALLGPAPPGGRTISLTSSRPDLVNVPASVAVEAGQAYAVFPVTTLPVAAPLDITITASADGASRSVTFTLTPPAIVRLQRAASSVGGGGSTSARIELNGPAPDGGVIAAISNGAPSLLGVPGTVTIPAGAVTATFSITTVPVASAQSATVTATLGGSSVSTTFLVAPIGLSRLSAPGNLARGTTVSTGSVILNGPAPAGGLTVALSASDPASLTIPSSVTVAAGATTAAFMLTAQPGGTASAVVITGTLAGVSRTFTVNLNTGQLYSLALRPPTIRGGATTTTHLVTLLSAAPPGGVAVDLTSSDPAALTVPASVTVAAGTTTRGFSVTAASTAIARQVLVVASAGGETRAQTMSIEPDQVALLSLASSLIQGGSALANNIVQLASPAPSGGAVVLLNSSNPAAQVPPSVLIPAGQTSAAFTIATSAVSGEVVATITATYGSLSGTAPLRILPINLSAITLAQASIPSGSSLPNNAVQIDAPAPAGGLAILLDSSDPAVSVPPSVVIPAGQMTGVFTLTTLPVGTPLSVNIRARFGTQSRTAALQLTAVYPVSIFIKTLGMTGGGVFTGNSVKLNRVAPAGGATVTLACNPPGAVDIPASLTVPEGLDTVPFDIAAVPAESTTPIVLTATAGGAAVSHTTAYIRPPSLSTITLAVTASAPGKTYATNSVRLNAKAPAAGFAIQLTSSDPANLTVPATAFVPAGLTVVNFPITVGVGAPAGNYVVTAARDGITRTDSFTVSTSVSLSSLALSPSSPFGGTSSSTHRVTLSAAAPPGGALVSLSSSLPSIAALPSTVTVPEAQTSATFTISTSAVSAVQPVTITATAGGVTRTATLSVQPARLSSVTAYPSALLGGKSTTQSKVNLTGSAPSGGFTVQLTSANPASVTVPATVVVPEGQSSVVYTAVTLPVAANTPVTITAAAGGLTKTAVLTVLPPALYVLTLSPTTVAANTTTTGHLVRLTGPAPSGGFVVALTSANPAVVTVPASVIVPAGASQVSVPLTSLAPSVATSVSITATSGAVSRSATVKVLPPA